MSLTAYSRMFKRELQVSQLKELFENSKPTISGDFKDFVKADVECSSCLARGAIVVREGKDASGRVVKQEHFAFRDASGGDPHQKYCDHYTGSDKVKSADNDALFDFRKSNSPITEKIKAMVCIGIENNIFSQQDIRDMREWYINLRTDATTKFEISHHLVNMANTAFRLYFKKPGLNKYVENRTKSISRDFDLDEEVYTSLLFKHPHYRFNNIEAQDKRWLNDARLSEVRKKAMQIIKLNNGELSFNRLELSDKVILTFRLASKIRESEDTLSSALSKSSTFRNNPLMALASLLLFVSEWDFEVASTKFNKILGIGRANDQTAGNVIGLNPFIHHSAWSIVQILDKIRRENNDDTDYEKAFENEKERLKKVYAIL
ncbi:hypothetical protein [Aeromonas dhakensis]|uniref:hypothetical protein n=1 Tax=Aeromonas dhakensis TaxID=196024 RepID=UPI0038D00893